MGQIHHVISQLNEKWREVQTLREVIAAYPIEELKKLPYNEMYSIYRAGMKQKRAERFIEDWVAFQLNVSKKSSMRYDRLNDVDGFDLGDLVSGSVLVPGKNNIELKVSFEGDSIGGGQFRFYEPIAGYLFMKAWNANFMEMFYLSRDELICEIKERGHTPKSFDRNGDPVYYAVIGSSQGSGKIKGCNDRRLVILEENIKSIRQDQIGWSFNARTEPDLYQKWQDKYLFTIEELKEKMNEIRLHCYQPGIQYCC